MEEHRDSAVGEAIDRIPVPPRDEAFLPSLLERLDAVDAERTAQASGRASGGRRRGAARLLGRHRAPSRSPSPSPRPLCSSSR
jgi:hypothetical protein